MKDRIGIALSVLFIVVAVALFVPGLLTEPVGPETATTPDPVASGMP